MAPLPPSPSPVPEKRRPGVFARLFGNNEIRRDDPVEHCLTCADRIELLRRGHLDCSVPEHADAMRKLGQMVMQRDAWRIRALEAETRLRHPAHQQPHGEAA